MRSAVIIQDQKNGILVGKGRVFSNLIKKKNKNAVIKGKIQTKNIVKRGTFCGEHSEKDTCFLYFEHTV